MSTGIGALRAPRQTAWPLAVLALLVVMTVAIIATTISLGVDGTDARFVGRHLVNTPTELSGGVIEGTVSGTAANTPSELSGGDFRRGRPTPRPTPKEFHTRIELGTTTPTEVSGGIVEGLPPEIYDRHQRA